MLDIQVLWLAANQRDLTGGRINNTSRLLSFSSVVSFPTRHITVAVLNTWLTLWTQIKLRGYVFKKDQFALK